MMKRVEMGIAIFLVICVAGLPILGNMEVFGGSVKAAEICSTSVDLGRKKASEETVEEEQAITFSRESGTYAEEFQLQLTCATSGAAIYYTKDGSDPSDPSNEARITYTGEGISVTDRKGDVNVLAAIDPVLFDAVNVKADSTRKDFVSTVEKPSDEAVDKCTVIKAAAQYADGTSSGVITNTYFIGEMAEHIEGIRKSCEAAGMDLSVISISMDEEDLFDSAKGIYVKGDTFKAALQDYLKTGGKLPSGSSAVDVCRQLDANYKQKGREWERETHIDYFESNGTDTVCKLQQDCGIRIQGNYSRSDYQKSFRLYARADYGKKNFKYGFWDTALDDSGKRIEKYKTIVLRNGGNCAFTTKFADSYWQSLMKDIACDSQSARPCAVYLNGEYWGIYVLQDDFRGSFMENKHGIPKEDVVIYKGDAEAIKDLGYKLDEGELPAGVTDESYYFREMEDFMASHEDLSNDGDYEEFAKIVDVQSAMDYFAAQVWINNKWDWPGKNWSMWKSTRIDEKNPYADGKWRFLIYDVEFGGISGTGDAYANTVSNSKLLEIGSAQQGDDNWDKPNVRCFAFLMSNEGFRTAFNERLMELSSTSFERENALVVATKYKEVYQPILEQFFKRFPTKWGRDIRTANMVINGHSGDTYGTWANIVSFVKARKENISSIVDYVNKQYPEKPIPTDLPVQSEEPAEDTPSPTTASSPIPTVAPPIVKTKAGVTKVTLADGTVKEVTVNEDGIVTSTRYTVNGVAYSLKNDGTLCFLAVNKGKLKKKTSVTIADVEVISGKKYKVTELEAGAFLGCTKLKKVSIGIYVKRIGKNAFKGCKKLRTITIASRGLKKVGNYAIQGIAKKAVILCPAARRKAYQKLFTAKTGYQKKTMKIKKVRRRL